MFYLIHVLAGIAIFRYFPSFWPILIISILSHFLLDIIPHKDNFSSEKLSKNYNPKITKKAVLLESADALASMIIIILFFSKFPSFLMLFSVFISLFPDIIKIGYLTSMGNNELFRKYLRFHSAIQWETGWFIGMLTQIIVAVIFLILLL